MKRRLSTPYDKALTLLFVVVWLVPIAWAGGWKKRVPGAPVLFQHQYRVACLFTHSQSRWTTYHMQIQLKGEDRWYELSEKGFFDMTVFGVRSRMHRILGQSFKKHKGQKRMREMGRFIRKRFYELHPDGPLIGGLRFVSVRHEIETMAAEEGAFEMKALKDWKGRKRWYFGEMRWDDKEAKHPGWGKKKAKKKKRAAKRKADKTKAGKAKVDVPKAKARASDAPSKVGPLRNLAPVGRLPARMLLPKEAPLPADAPARTEGEKGGTP